MRTVYGVPSFEGFMELASHLLLFERAKRRQQRVRIPAELVAQLREFAEQSTKRTRRICLFDLELER